MSEDINKRVAQYIQVRDALKRIDAEYEQKRKPLLELQEVLSGRLRTFIETNKLENLKTEAGTCYISTRYTASLADPAIFMDFVIKNQAFDLLDRRANATAVTAYVKEHNNLPPGCNLNGIQSVGVRRKPGT